MKKYIIILFCFLLSIRANAQNGDEVFGFLRYPSSARINALGGTSVALVERDPSLVFHNPGLLGGEMDGMINLNYMNYISDINVGSAIYAKAHKERGAWAIGASYIHYGNFTEASRENITGGSVSANDINLQGVYAYDLSDRWRGGLSLKFLYSAFAEYTSIGLAVDAGLTYYHSEKEFSFGFALKNIGAQLKAYEEERHSLPWDIQLGITKKLANAPFRFSVTGQYLNRWKFNYTDQTIEGDREDNFGKTLFKHLVFGVDFIPSENFWVGVGYNPKRGMDMKLESGNTLGGFSAGAGVKVSYFDVGVSVAQYHPSAMALMISISTTLSDFRP
ncbi:long-subunit fatty acid transport protein [Parabacteroides sp. PFB2-10]|uniref:type IX secretion system protein PorQ n=1 Tax=Parabacteroides sp. PFB2-10 TaxID=1742405 RepID=UPI0024740061|nr:type IX secretion system protein PorQ [Parabacteroides sp. PFB2-10]MDH6313954.1 long-subunit fatty acid transport protein [Parabacteroides sp. PFB2-10]